MITQEQLFETAVAPPKPPVPPKSAILAEPLGTCCKCEEPATRRSPSGKYIYCETHGKCGGRTAKTTALGVSMDVCGRSVEEFVKHPTIGIWVCPCMLEVR
jgi:hypothetical protein